MVDGQAFGFTPFQWKRGHSDGGKVKTLLGCKEVAPRVLNPIIYPPNMGVLSTAWCRAGEAVVTMLVNVMPAVDGETWVHVSSSSVVDWPTVEASLSGEVRASLIGKRTYYPSCPVGDSYSFGDWWVFSTTHDAAWLEV